MTRATLSELVTVVGGNTVAISTRDGAVTPDAITGIYHGDRRLLSRLRLTIGGHALALISTSTPRADRLVTHHLVTDAAGVQRALLTRTRSVDGRAEEEVVVRAFGTAVALDLRLEVAADFANLLRVRYGEEAPPPAPFTADGASLIATRDGLGVRVEAPGAVIEAHGTCAWALRAAPGAPATAGFAVGPFPGRERTATTGTALRVTGDHRWQRAVDTAVGDLAALRTHLADRDVRYVAAGAPWYMALFGRDALLTGFEALPAGTDAALDALAALAAFQGEGSDASTGEQPGKILHELRTGYSGIFGLQPWQPYYGSVDATPLFVHLLGEVHRWGAPPDRVRELLPAARAAVAWCAANADRHPRGYLTYAADEHALHNQGWKDAADSMVHADGTLADQPIALVEAQAYHWRALRELAALERALGDAGAAGGLLERADRLQAHLHDDFFDPRRGLLAMALDGHGEPLRVASSNAGHCLWTGVLDAATGDAVAAMLRAPAMNAGWGVRTLGAEERAYDPMSYHCGSVWPHDSALVVDGLARYGATATAAGLVGGLLDAAEHHGWRLPELYAGYGSDEVAAPVPYPVACSPQAWSAAAPLQLLRTVLGIDPDVPSGTVTVGPPLMDVSLRVEGVRLGRHRLDLEVHGGAVEAVTDPGLRVVHR